MSLADITWPYITIPPPSNEVRLLLESVDAFALLARQHATNASTKGIPLCFQRAQLTVADLFQSLYTIANRLAEHLKLDDDDYIMYAALNPSAVNVLCGIANLNDGSTDAEAFLYLMSNYAMDLIGCVVPICIKRFITQVKQRWSSNAFEEGVYEDDADEELFLTRYIIQRPSN